MDKKEGGSHIFSIHQQQSFPTPVASLCCVHEAANSLLAKHYAIAGKLRVFTTIP